MYRLLTELNLFPHFIKQEALFVCSFIHFIYLTFSTVFTVLEAKLLKMYGLLTKCEVKMAGYWSSFSACLWTETKSRSINSQKKNEANIQPS